MFDTIFTWFEARYSPVALAQDRQPPQGLTRFVLYFVRQFRGAFIARMALVAVGSIADAMLPIFVGIVVGMLTDTSPGRMFADNWQTLLLMAAVVAIVRPVTFILDTLVRNHSIAASFVNLVRWQSHYHVIRQSWSFFQNEFAGRIGNRVLQSGEAAEAAINATIDAVWYAAVFVVVAITVLVRTDVVLVLPILLWLVAYGLLFAVVMPKIVRHSELLSEAKSVMTGRMVDSYTNIQTLKTFSAAAEEDRYVAESVLGHAAEYRRLVRVFTAMWSILFGLNAALVLSITWLALAGWNDGTLNATAVATAVPFALQIMNMSGWILEVGANVFRQLGTVRDSMETIAQPIALLDAPAAEPLRVTAGEIVFSDVTFNYWRGKSGTVIENFDLRIAPGEKVGLVGRSGAGKSTLVNLALRLFDVQDGSIRIDGQDVRAVTQESLRAAIGLVSQDTSLLHRSVRANIKFGRPSASDDEMRLAAAQARVDDVIDTLSDHEGRHGYDAHVGERGVKLSGGQRQRIAIARVLLKDAPILILDEATSALDSEVEAAIQEQLAALMQGKTVIAIAHRLSTIAAMDRLVVLEAGRIVEEGTHAALLARGGHYAQLWERQSGGFLDLDAGPAG